MLSYLHGFHAGNFADIHKHAAMRIILDYLCNKEKPFCVIDTHAGSGWYDLGSAQSAKTGEWKNGIAAAQQKGNAPKQMQPFLDQIAAFDPIAKGRDYGVFEDDDLKGPFYPGSPFIMRELLRDHDEIILMEL
ncbi:MAG TPA: 23S rRNA (adenine(2030)-N(6))-methyltransferase RlmJ, partial [Alcanivorax sp.]|nr:23S rRNA (adenine(2030)-N(6))-methyltransferase RlmJ [Alcanivorax sp.]